MRHIIFKESNYQPDAVGDFGHSFGLVQIYLPAHPDVSKAEALDPTFAVDFLASNLAKGKCYWWTTCPR